MKFIRRPRAVRPTEKKRPVSSAPASLLMVLAPLVMTGCGLAKPQSVDNRSMPDKFVPGSFLVEVSGDGEADHATALREAAQKAATSQGCEAGEPAPVKWETSTGAISKRLANTYHVEFSGCELDAVTTEGLLDSLSASSSVANVQANATLEAVAAVVENDPSLPKQYYLSKINRQKACEALPKKNQRPIVVAVIDSGVDMDHPDLVDAFYRDSSGRIVGANFVDKGASASPDGNWDDGNGHGTHVAGLVAATSNNGMGVAGVASCANVKIMPIRALNAQGSGNNLEIERAVQWAVKNGADVINMSLGGARTFASKPNSMSSALYDSVAQEGVIVFAAAGNDGAINGGRNANGYVYHFPSSYDNVISVASTDETGGLSSFSNRGSLVDIAAPGSNLYATYPDKSYKSLSGTSMASPVAAGSYALALASVGDKAKRRIHHDEVMEYMKKAVRTSEPALNTRMVATAGVVDSAVLMNEMLGVSGQLPDDQKPIVAEPEKPADPTPTPAPSVDSFGFVGLIPAQRLTDATSFALQSLPSGTRYVYLYWGRGSQVETFARFQVNGSSMKSADEWYLIGQGTLYAEATDMYGRRLGVITMPLTGLSR